MGRSLAFVFLLAACEGGSSASFDAAATSGLVVHLGDAYAGRFGVRVLLGDGTRHVGIPDATGTVRFDVEPPQDVTIVEEGLAFVRTFAGIDRHEFSPTRRANDPACPCAASWLRGTVTGNLQQTVEVRAVNADEHHQVSGTATFEILVSRPSSVMTPYDLVAFDGYQGRAINVGMRRDVVLPAGEMLEGQDIALDHPFEPSFAITPQNAAATGGAYRARLLFSLHDYFLFGTETSTFPATVATPVMDAAIDNIERRAQVLSGANDELDVQRTDPASFFGDTIVAVPANATSATVELLEPARITAPAVGTYAAPPIVGRDGLVIGWSADENVETIALTVYPTETQNLVWTVHAPASRGSFTFFPLPTGVAPTTTFTTGPHRFQLVQTTNVRWTDPLDVIPAVRAQTTQWSMVDFQ